ncbi:MlaD family protein [Bdellovibrio sp. KM01]|uniref:MlaD family protein n=1 Tax=Bdellovibrio sp. KM01 TaxID=2748865 RepID=UPI0015EA9199|nr:MlaD family protein [Bdellovibrio sp. KM01]QLY26253.1 MCE family protein [Bdellovibrio sp. KM01]
MMKNLKATWFVWLFPLFAVILSGYLLLEFYQHRGPEVTITFEEGTRIRPDKTEIRFRGVRVGVVTSVRISDDQKSVEVHARLEKFASDFANEGTKYWLESPRISFEEIRGLDTLVEGSYISAVPGTGSRTKKFVGRSGTELKNPLEETALFKLETRNLDSVSDGDTIFYRGMNVGSVTKVALSKTGQTISVHFRVPWEYARLVRTNTVFWRKAGFQAKLGLFNSFVKMNSVDALLRGGIELATPTNAGPKAKPGTTFALVGEAPKEADKWNPVLE